MLLLVQSVFEAQMVLLRCLRDVLQVRAGGERALPPEPGRLAAVQGCRDVLRTVLDELWNVCVGVLRDAQMDPYCLPIRLHGRVPPCGPRWGEQPTAPGRDVDAPAGKEASSGVSVRHRFRSPRRGVVDGRGVDGARGGFRV